MDAEQTRAEDQMASKENKSEHETIDAVLVVTLPNGRELQVAGSVSDIEAMIGIVKQLPQEVRGSGRVFQLSGDSLFDSYGKEIGIMPNSVSVPNFKS